MLVIFNSIETRGPIKYLKIHIIVSKLILIKYYKIIVVFYKAFEFI